MFSGFKVAMHDALFVRRGKALRDRDGDLHGPPRHQRSAGQALPQRLALEQLHDEDVA